MEISKTKITIAGSVFYILGVCAFLSGKVFIFALVLLFVLIGLLIKNKVSPKLSILLYFLFSLALLNCHFQIKNFDDLSQYVDTKGRITGVVESIPTTNVNGKTKFYLSADTYDFEGKNLKNLNARTIVTLYDSSEKLEKIKIGDRVSLDGKLRKPIKAKNPSQFDYANYLKNHKTFSTFYSKDKNWEIVSKPESLNGKFLQKLNEKRSEIIDIHKKYMKSPNLEVLGGIVFGDDAVNPPDEVKTSFINSGLLHILAASGMNVSIIFGIWFFIAKRLRFNYRFIILFGAFLVAVYTLMTGMGPSVLRAAFMIEFILLGKLIDRNTEGISLVFFVAFLMLLYNPAMITDVGFQLSYVVTFALMLNCPAVLENIKNKVAEFVAGTVLIPVVAQFWASPIQMAYFNTFATYSILANVAIAPFIIVISFLGFLGSIIAMVPIPALADKTCMLFDFVLNPVVTGLVKISDYFSSLPNSLLTAPNPGFLKLLFYYGALLVFGFLIKGKFKSKKLIGLFLGLLLAFALCFVRIASPNPEILVFDMGNADSFLIKTPQGKYLLIDTGKGSINSGFSMTDAVVGKYLKDNGIRILDVLVLTHFDFDHSGGAIDIMKTVKVKKLVLNKDRDGSKTTNAIMSYVKKTSQEYLEPKNNEKLFEEGDFSLTAFTPDFKNDKNDNDNSIVTLLSYGDFDMLFMADGGVRSFSKIKKDLPLKKIEVLKVGHHGAKGVVDENMLKALNPEIAVISTGFNTYGHPNKETLRTLAFNGLKIYRTDSDNAIKITTDGKNYEIKKFNTRKKKFTND